MKKTIACIAIVGVLCVAVLGFISMADHGNHAFRSCVGRVTGSECPQVTQSIGDIAAHITAAQKLGMAIPNLGTTEAALLGALLALFFLSRLSVTHLPQLLAVCMLRIRTSFPPLLLARQLTWLAHLEARDPHAFSMGA